METFQRLFQAKLLEGLPQDHLEAASVVVRPWPGGQQLLHLGLPRHGRQRTKPAHLPLRVSQLPERAEVFRVQTIILVADQNHIAMGMIQPGLNRLAQAQPDWVAQAANLRKLRRELTSHLGRIVVGTVVQNPQLELPSQLAQQVQHFLHAVGQLALGVMNRQQHANGVQTNDSYVQSLDARPAPHTRLSAYLPTRPAASPQQH